MSCDSQWCHLMTFHDWRQREEGIAALRVRRRGDHAHGNWSEDSERVAVRLGGEWWSGIRPCGGRCRAYRGSSAAGPKRVCAPGIVRPAPRHRPRRSSGPRCAHAMGRARPGPGHRVRPTENRRGTDRPGPRQRPADDDGGTWPCQPVRDLLEVLQSERVERSLLAPLYNERGVTARNPEDGGKQERKLAEQYRAQAIAFSNTWPQTAAVLRKLALMYDTDARQEEDRAERFRRGQR
jgi:hypothetical protein